MPSYEVVLDEEGRAALPRELIERLGLRPGERLELVELVRPGHPDRAPAIGIGEASEPTSPMPRPDREVAPRRGDLGALRLIAREARAAGVKPSTSDDPVGDYLLELDDRTRSRPR